MELYAALMTLAWKKEPTGGQKIHPNGTSAQTKETAV